MTATSSSRWAAATNFGSLWQPSHDFAKPAQYGRNSGVPRFGAEVTSCGEPWQVAQEGPATGASALSHFAWPEERKVSTASAWH